MKTKKKTMKCFHDSFGQCRAAALPSSHLPCAGSDPAEPPSLPSAVSVAMETRSPGLLRAGQAPASQHAAVWVGARMGHRLPETTQETNGNCCKGRGKVGEAASETRDCSLLRCNSKAGRH